VLTIDLTNRCNMMCDPCFMDANQVGFVHELAGKRSDAARQRDHAEAEAPDVRAVLGRRADVVAVLPGRVPYAKKVGYNSVQAATNGIEFAKSPDFARAAAEAGLRYAYLQFDGIGNAANSHRLVGNLFDVKLRAIENLWRAGVDIVPVTTMSTASTTSRSAASSSSRSTTRRRFRSSRSSRCRSRAATRRLPTSAGPRSATRCRTWRTT
jgi:uncharacterized radical SAM superfamily Fe-S cluster-containing enzyme